MSMKIKNILRGAGSVISIGGAASIRPSMPVGVTLPPIEEALAGDFRQIGSDLSKGFEEIRVKELAHG